MARTAKDQYSYELQEDFGTRSGQIVPGMVMDVAVDSRDQVYAIRLGDPPVIVFDSSGNYVRSWGKDLTYPHGITIDAEGFVYITDRDGHMAIKFDQGGRPLLSLGVRGTPSDTGCTADMGPVLRPGGPFNKPTKMFRAPSGDLYVSDGYRNCRIHRFSPSGKLVASWGEYGSGPGQFHVPHSLWVDKDGLVYVCDRDNSRVQVFSDSGKFLTQYGDLFRPTSIYMDKSDTIYVTEILPRMSVLDKKGKILARIAAPSWHGISGDSKGNLYTASHMRSKLAKYVRKH